jgi:hypothetical protein
VAPSQDHLTWVGKPISEKEDMSLNVLLKSEMQDAKVRKDIYPQCRKRPKFYDIAELCNPLLTRGAEMSFRGLFLVKKYFKKRKKGRKGRRKEEKGRRKEGRKGEKEGGKEGKREMSIFHHSVSHLEVVLHFP